MHINVLKADISRLNGLGSVHSLIGESEGTLFNILSVLRELTR